MNKYARDINQTINEFLTASVKLEQIYEKSGQHEEAQAVRGISSAIAERTMEATGLRKELRAFWNAKKAMIRTEAI